MRPYLKRTEKIFCLAFMAVFLLLPAFSCAPVETTDSESTTSVTETRETSFTEETAGRPDYPSGILRLWWPERSNFNPLDDKSKAGQAVYDLIFEGLFRIEADQSLTPLLAERLEFAENGRRAVVTLRDRQYFHDGNKLTSADIKACLDYLLSSDSGLAEILNLDNIVQVETAGELVLHIELEEPQPWLAYSLTFPVIQTPSLNADNFTLIAGSGKFKMSSWQQETGLLLELAESSEDISALDTILVRSYPDEKSAMQGFENDEIDLVWLSADDYQTKSRRSDLRTETYPGDRLVLLGLNTEGNRPLAQAQHFLLVKQLLYSQDLRTDAWLKYGDTVSVPLSPESFLISGADINPLPLLQSPGPAVWSGDDTSLKIILPDDCAIRQMLAEWVSGKLKEADIESVLTKLPAESFWEAVSRQNYDIALLQTVMPPEPTPLFLLGPEQDLVPLARQSITGYDDYQAWQELLLGIWDSPPEQMMKPDDLALALKHTTAQSPFIFLMIRSEAVLKGDRIWGQSNPDRYHPYEGIEELWVWSSQ